MLVPTACLVVVRHDATASRSIARTGEYQRSNLECSIERIGINWGRHLWKAWTVRDTV